MKKGKKVLKDPSVGMWPAKTGKEAKRWKKFHGEQES